MGVNSNVAPKGFFDVPVFTGDERIIVFKVAKMAIDIFLDHV